MLREPYKSNQLPGEIYGGQDQACVTFTLVSAEHSERPLSSGPKPAVERGEREKGGVREVLFLLLCHGKQLKGGGPSISRTECPSRKAWWWELRQLVTPCLQTGRGEQRGSGTEP